MRHVPFFAMCLLLASRPASTQAVEWETLPPLPAPNGGFMAGVIEKDKILVAGGTNWEGGVKNWLKHVHVFDTAKMRWSTLKDAMDTPVAYGLEAPYESEFRFLGGSDGKQALHAGASWKQNTLKQEPLQGLPASLVLLAGGMVKEQLVLVGGMSDPANLAGVTCETHVINQTGIERRANYPGKPFAVAAHAMVGEELLIFGGMNYDADTHLPANTDKACAYSPARDTWRVLKPLAKPNRGLSAVALDGRHVYLAGGYGEDFTADAVIYDVKSDTYKPAPPLPQAAMVKLLRCGDFVYCLGGEDKKQSRSDKCFRVKVADLLK